MGRNRTQCHSRQNSQPALVGLLAAMLLFTFRPQISSAQEMLIDRLAAEVNGEPITYSEVMNKVQKGPLIAVAPYPATENDVPFTVALNDLINSKLIMQKAEEYQIEVTDEELDQEINQFLTRRNLSMDGLREALHQQGMTMDEYRDDFKNQMILSQFQGRVIMPAVKITDKDIELFYMSSNSTDNSNVKVTLRQILVKTDGSAAASIQKGKAELAKTIIAKLREGMSFEEAAKVYSDDEDARKTGGLMPAVYLKDLSPDFQKPIAQLTDKQFTDPIKTSNGYYIFYLEGKALASNQDFERKKRDLETKLRQQEIAKQTTRWLADQHRRSKIKILTDEVKK